MKLNKLDFPKETKLLIAERDCGCIYCGSHYMLSYAHIFVPRSKGGLGVKENGALLCMKCHGLLDNGVSGEIADRIDNYCKEYLTNIYGVINKEDLIYNKWR